MAHARKRYRPRERFYRCGRCRSPIPVGYSHCGQCGYNRNEWEDALVAHVLRIFPGSRELPNDTPPV